MMVKRKRDMPTCWFVGFIELRTSLVVITACQIHRAHYCCIQQDKHQPLRSASLATTIHTKHATVQTFDFTGLSYSTLCIYRQFVRAIKESDSSVKI
jgi:hypothetical protein